MEEKDIKQTTDRLPIEEPIETVTPDLDTPPSGKVWRRISDGMLFPGQVFLGELHFVDGKKLKKPKKEVPDDFELIDVENPCILGS